MNPAAVTWMARIASTLLLGTAALIAGTDAAVATDFGRFERVRIERSRALTASRAAPASIAEQAAASSDPVAFRALAAYAGDDLEGSDGPMARAGLDLTLLHFEYREFLAAPQAPSFVSTVAGVRHAGGTVLVDIVTEQIDDDSLLAQLDALGLVASADLGRVISGWLPIAALDAASQLAGLRSIRPVYLRIGAGVVTSQGDIALEASPARMALGVDGTGMTVGVISDSFDCQSAYVGDISTGDLPSGINVLEEIGNCTNAIDEGRAMAQIIHDLAPGSAIAFHSGFNGSASFAQGIGELAAAGSDIVVDDVGLLYSPMFQDGIVAQAVDTVVSQGVAYFSSAGNAARRSYESAFRGVTVSVPGPDPVRHDFDSTAGVDTLQTLTIPANGIVGFSLQWDQPFYSVSGPPGATSDLALLFFGSPAINPVVQSSDDNLLTGDAVDVVVFQNTSSSSQTLQLAIELVAGPAPSLIKYIVFGDATINEYDTGSNTIFGHTNAAGARAVGASYYQETPAFGVSPPLIETFSSRGGTTIRFSATGAISIDPRDKPEIVATDGVDTTFFGTDTDGSGYPNFFGTSAAAPHAAAIAALLKDLDPIATPAAMSGALLESTIDMLAPGFDEDSGRGLVQADLALAYLALNTGDGTLLGFGADSNGGILLDELAADEFAGLGVSFEDSDSSAATTMIEQVGTTVGTFLGQYIHVQPDPGGTWLDLDFTAFGAAISFSFATPYGAVSLAGYDEFDSLIWSGTASGTTPFGGPDGETWLSGNTILPAALSVKRLRITASQPLEGLAVDNVHFTNSSASAVPVPDVDVPIPLPAIIAAFLTLTLIGICNGRADR